MITVSVDFCNPVSQKIYDDVIYSLQLHQLVCPCGRSGCLTVHGYYSRSVKSGDSSVRLRICRLLCSQCGHTHAVLLSSMVPYSQVSFPDQVEVLGCFETGRSFSSVMGRTPSIDESCARSIIRQFRRHWKERLLSVPLSLAAAPDFIKNCFRAFHRQFMQIKRTPNILFLPPT